MANTGATTLGAITLAARQRADMENSDFISDPEATTLVNASLQALYEKLIEAYGSDYEVAAAYQFTTDGTSDTFTLPGDFFKLLGVDLQLNSGSVQGWVTLWRFNFGQRNQYTLPNMQTMWGRTNLKYRLRGGSIWFTPLPQGGQVLQLWYAPRFVPLVNSTDSFDGINGWEEWAVNDAAMKMRVKEESGIDDLMRLQAVQNDRLSSIIDNRDIGSPATTVDVYRANGWGGGGCGPGDWGDGWGS